MIKKIRTYGDRNESLESKTLMDSGEREGRKGKGERDIAEVISLKEREKGI